MYQYRSFGKKFNEQLLVARNAGDSRKKLSILYILVNPGFRPAFFLQQRFRLHAGEVQDILG